MVMRPGMVRLQIAYSTAFQIASRNIALIVFCRVHIADRDPRLPEGWKVPTRASPCDPGSLGSGMVG